MISSRTWCLLISQCKNQLFPQAGFPGDYRLATFSKQGVGIPHSDTLGERALPTKSEQKVLESIKSYGQKKKKSHKLNGLSQSLGQIRWVHIWSSAWSQSLPGLRAASSLQKTVDIRDTNTISTTRKLNTTKNHLPFWINGYLFSQVISSYYQNNNRLQCVDCSLQF